MGVSFSVKNSTEFITGNISVCFLSEKESILICRNSCGEQRNISYINYPSSGKYYIAMYLDNYGEIYRSGFYEFGNPPFSHNFGIIYLAVP